MDYRRTAWADYPSAVIPGNYRGGPVLLPRVEYEENPKGDPDPKLVSCIRTKFEEKPRSAADSTDLALIGPYCQEAVPTVGYHDQRQMLITLKTRFLLPNAEDDDLNFNKKDSFDAGFWSYIHSIIYEQRTWNDWQRHQKKTVGRIMLHQRAHGVYRQIGEKLFGSHDGHLKTEKMLKIVCGVRGKHNERFICAQRESENYLLGPYISSMQHCLMKRCHEYLNEGGPPPLILSTCGMTLTQAGSVIKKVYDSGYTDIYCVDKSAFDRTITTQALEFEQSVYEAISPMNLQQRAAFVSQRERTVRCTNGVKLGKIKGRRNSGDPNTTIGNTILSCATARMTLRRLGFPDHVCISVGDDLLILLPPANRPRFVTDFAKDQKINYGFKNKVRGPDAPWDVDFLSCRLLPALVNGSYTWTLSPLLAKCVPKVFYSVSPVARARPLDMLRTVNECMMYLFQADPIAMSLFKKVERFCGEGKVVTMTDADRTGILYLMNCHETREVRPHPDYHIWTSSRYNHDFASLKSVVMTHQVVPFHLPFHVIQRDIPVDDEQRLQSGCGEDVGGKFL